MTTIHRSRPTPPTAHPASAEVEVVLLGLFGGLIREDGKHERAFAAAAERCGLVRGPAQLAALRFEVRERLGQDTADVARALSGGPFRAEPLRVAFEEAFAAELRAGTRPVPGAAEAVRRLRAAGAVVAVATGHSAQLREAALAAAGLTGLCDVALSPRDAGRGAPAPDLALTGLLRGSGSSVDALVVVGDTANEVAAGVNAGAGLVVGVRGGAHRGSELEAAGADLVIAGIAELAELLGAPAAP